MTVETARLIANAVTAAIFGLILWAYYRKTRR
jgi:hypothetical protein